MVRRMFCALCRLLLSLPGCKLLKIKGACMLARARFANVRWALRAQLICKLFFKRFFPQWFSMKGMVKGSLFQTCCHLLLLGSLVHRSERD